MQRVWRLLLVGTAGWDAVHSICSSSTTTHFILSMTLLKLSDFIGGIKSAIQSVERLVKNAIPVDISPVRFVDAMYRER
jgi:hypothetical protein